MRYLVKGFTEVHVYNILCLSLIYQLRHFLEKLDQVSEARSSLHKTMLSIFNKSCFLIGSLGPVTLTLQMILKGTITTIIQIVEIK